MIAIVVMMIAMVFMVPMTLMHLPAALIMIVVRMAPVSSRIRRPLPNPWDPDIPSAPISPVAIDPDKAFARKSRPHFIPYGWRSTEVNLDLAECRDC
jgi:hypothetical protein